MHADREKLISWYLSIRWSNLGNGHIVAIVSLKIFFMICDEWFNAWNVIVIFGYSEWSFQSSYKIKLWVQNWVSTILYCKTFLFKIYYFYFFLDTSLLNMFFLLDLLTFHFQLITWLIHLMVILHAQFCFFVFLKQLKNSIVFKITWSSKRRIFVIYRPNQRLLF